MADTKTNTQTDDLVYLNRPKVIDYPYIAGFEGKKVGLYAPSLLAAKQKAVEHFRPSKKKAGLIWVELAHETDSDQ
jgi:hypothetical protein